MRNRPFFSRVLGFAMLALGATLTSPTWAQDPVKAFDLPAQDAGAGLAAFARQADVQLLISATDARNHRTNEIRGAFPIEEALNRLLDGTGLAAEATGPQTYTIVVASAGRHEANAQEVHVAQAAGNDQASAGAGDGQTEKLEEVVVTAQKRRERLQDVPISITALSGRDLDRSTGGLIDALTFVPGVSMVGGSNLSGNNLFSVRGVVTGNGAFAGSSTVGYYIDAVPFGFVRNAQVPDVNSFDLQQVEVLRGPQGTLYGASSLNGVVRILTHDADLTEFQFKSRATLSDTQGGDGNYRADAAINVPIVQDKLAVRAVVGYENIGGWIDNPVQRNANDNRSLNGRIKLNAQPNDKLSLGLSAWFSRLDSGAPSVSSVPSPAGDNFFAGHNDQSGSTDFNTYGFKIGYELPGVSLSSMTSYIDYKNLTKVDFSSLDFGIDAAVATTMSSRALSEEFLARSTEKSAWRWTAGAFYRDTDEKFSQLLLGFDNPDINDLSRSFAFFGELTRGFDGGKFELTGGLRYFEDEVRMHENFPNSQIPTDPLFRIQQRFDAVTPRVVLTWHPQSLEMLYASYSKGFRSGFHNFPYVYSAARALGADIPAISPDNLKNYELGTKGSSAGGRVSYDASVYYQDWQHIAAGAATIELEVNGQQVPFSALGNGGSASGMGVDLAANFRPWRGLNLGLSFSWNNLGYDTATLDPITQAVVIPKGTRLVGSAEYTAGASAEYLFPLGENGLQGRFSASANYSSPRPMSATVESDSIVDTKVAFSLESADRWTGSLFVDNVTNERRIFNTDFIFLTYSQLQRPRTVGLQFEYRVGRN